MRGLGRIRTALRGWFRPHALDAELSEELRFHLERDIQANIEAGMPPEEARRAAHVTIGNISAVREASRAGRSGAVLHQAARDLRLAMRLVRKAPGFAASAALVVALGIGTTTAIFSVVYGVMLRPLPYDEPERLVALWSRVPGAAQRVRVNAADQRVLVASNTVFDDIALATAPQNFNLTGSGEPERVVAARLSSNFLSVLRVRPVLGRGFTAADEQRGQDPVVLISDGLWKRRFGADPAVLGRTINLSGNPYEVIGVMPPDFQFPAREHQLWIPLTINPRVLAREIANHDHFAIARLRRGVPIDRARRELDGLARRLEADYPGTNRGVRIDVLPFLEESVRPIRSTLYVLLAAVGCLLLVACLNLAGLLGARAAGRTQEFSVRLALGASRGRLVLQALAEVAPMVVGGGIAGILGAKWAVAAFLPIAPPVLPRADSIEVSGSVLVFSVITLALTGGAAGLLPAIQSWRARAVSATIGSRSATTGRRHVRTRSALVIAQLALSLPLLVGAAALSRSFSGLMRVDPGFGTENVLSLHMAIPRGKYESDERIAVLYRQIVDRVTAAPGVISAGMVNRLPLAGNNLVLPFELEGGPGKPVNLQVRSVTPEYFRTMNIPLLQGRRLAESDGAKAPLVGVVDERVARTLWPGQSAIGKRFRVTIPGGQPAWGEVVGIVPRIHDQGLDRDDDRQIYLSYQQFTDGRIALVVRTHADPGAMTTAVVQAIRSVDPDQPVYDVRTMDSVLARSAAERWLNMAIIVAFAAASLLLAGAGLYGVIASGVTERRREFGVRLALGAAPSDVSRLVVRKGAALAGTGAALGLSGAVALVRGMDSLLYGVPRFDPVSFATAGVLLFGVALTASYLPARRAALIDPARTLRAE
jgi:putative ABC transport system permease protein